MAEKPSIINIINFVRGCEPRQNIDLHKPVREQLSLLSRFGFQGTFLLQYDAMLDPILLEMLRDTPHEIGIWLEVVEPMAKAAGIPWRGRFPWDWHSHVGFTVGYPPQEREKLVDVAMQKFRSIFGAYPKSVGSWMIDAHTLAYLSGRYGVTASCNCKDQWGTDGYTLWGGYYGQAYYPCKHNAYAPAQSGENQIPIPVFKMLGADPIYQYDLGLSKEDGGSDRQGVVTLEPVYTKGGGGGDPDWVRWFFSEVMTSCCVSFRYAQVGQENSFGWPAMAAGLTDQLELIHSLARQNKLRVETLAKSAAWFRERYPLTPNAAISALTDWRHEGRKSIWFSTRKYRINLYVEDNQLWIRDLTLFADPYHERYMDAVCEGPDMTYDNLPIMDGNRFSGGGIRAGCYLQALEGPLSLISLNVREEDERLIVQAQTDQGDVAFTLDTETVAIHTNVAGLSLVPRFYRSKELSGAQLHGRTLSFWHEGMRYALEIQEGSVSDLGIRAQDGKIVINI